MNTLHITLLSCGLLLSFCGGAMKGVEFTMNRNSHCNIQNLAIKPMGVLSLQLRGGSWNKPRVLSVHDFRGWMNVTENETRFPFKPPNIGHSRSFFSFGGVENAVPLANQERIIEMLRQNRQLIQRCKCLRARALDDETRIDLDSRISELESAWNSYIKINPMAIKWETCLMRAPIAEEEKYRLIPVTFVVECDKTKVGDEIVVTGDAEELGCWRESCAITLKTDPITFPKWNATVLLRAGECIEYKYAILRRPGEDSALPGVLVWENFMGNRGFKVPRRAHLVEDGTIEPVQEISVEIWRAPRFLRMHSSELYLDPEYAMVLTD